MDAKLLARGFASMRIGVGIALFAAPTSMARAWFGGQSDGQSTLLTRAVGARDVAIGLGQLVTVDSGQSANWIDAGVAADTADLSAAVMGRQALGVRATLVTVLAAAASAATGIYVKQQLLRELTT